MTEYFLKPLKYVKKVICVMTKFNNILIVMKNFVHCVIPRLFQNVQSVKHQYGHITTHKKLCINLFVDTMTH